LHRHLYDGNVPLLLLLCHPLPLQGPEADPIWQPALPVPQVVDTTGAGDCFTAAFMVGLLQGLGPAEALRWASAAASLCVQRAGAMPSMPEREEVEAVFRS
jgi:ribokinase